MSYYNNPTEQLDGLINGLGRVRKERAFAPRDIEDREEDGNIFDDIIPEDPIERERKLEELKLKS